MQTLKDHALQMVNWPAPFAVAGLETMKYRGFCRNSSEVPPRSDTNFKRPAIV